MLVVQGGQGGMLAEVLLQRGVQRPAQLHRRRGAHRHAGPGQGGGVVQGWHSSLTIYLYIRRMQGQGHRVVDPLDPPKKNLSGSP